MLREGNHVEVGQQLFNHGAVGGNNQNAQPVDELVAVAGFGDGPRVEAPLVARHDVQPQRRVILCGHVVGYGRA